jgi:glycosyltransferase involved in cell wall biosynthesis
MKILHIIIGLNKGGAEVVLYNLLKNENNISDQINNKHIVLSLTNLGHFGNNLKKDGIDVHCLHLDKNIFNLFFLSMLIKRINPDIIQSWMHHANLIGSLFVLFNQKYKLIWALHSLDLDKKFNKKSTILIGRLCSILSNFAPKAIIFVSEMSKINHLNYGFNSKKSIIIHNGIEINRFYKNKLLRNSFRNTHSIDLNTFLIGKVARWDKYKDHENLFKALAKLKLTIKNFKCILVGNGLDNSNIQLLNLIEKYNLNDFIILLGQQDDIPAVMNAIDLHVLSSVGESMPISLLEAMACGTVCIATDVGACREIISDFGIIVPKQDYLALFNSLLEIYNMNYEQLQNRSNGGINHVESNFNINLMCMEYNKIWNLIK